MSKNKQHTNPKKLDATQFKWEQFNLPEKDIFAAFIADDGPKERSIGEVFFDEATFEDTDWQTNGASFSYYGSGSIYQYAAVQLESGAILFCIVSGASFQGTFSEDSGSFSMRYYRLTPLTDAKK